MNAWFSVAIAFIILFVVVLSLYLYTQSKYDALLSQYATLQRDYNNLQLQYNALNSEYQNLLNSYATLQSQYNQLQNQYEYAESQYNQLNSKYTQLQSQYDSLQSQYSQLQAQYENASNYIYSIMNDLQVAILNYGISGDSSHVFGFIFIPFGCTLNGTLIISSTGSITVYVMRWFDYVNYISGGVWSWTYQWNGITNLNQQITLTSGGIDGLYYVIIIKNNNNYPVFVTIQLTPSHLVCNP